MAVVRATAAAARVAGLVAGQVGAGEGQDQQRQQQQPHRQQQQVAQLAPLRGLLILPGEELQGAEALPPSLAPQQQVDEDGNGQPRQARQHRQVGEQESHPRQSAARRSR